MEEHKRSRPRNQGPNGPNAEKPLKVDLPFEDAVRRAMRAGKPTEKPGPAKGRETGRKGGSHGGA